MHKPKRPEPDSGLNAKCMFPMKDTAFCIDISINNEPFRGRKRHKIGHIYVGSETMTQRTTNQRADD